MNQDRGLVVIHAQAEIQAARNLPSGQWISAFAGMTVLGEREDLSRQ